MKKEEKPNSEAKRKMTKRKVRVSPENQLLARVLAATAEHVELRKKV